MQPIDNIKYVFEKVNEVTHVPYAYRVFKVDKDNEAPVPPYITYFIGREQYSGSDTRSGTCVIKNSYIVIELFTIEKDFDIEACLETEFDNLFGPDYEKTEEYDYNENLFRITYEINTTNKIRR